MKGRIHRKGREVLVSLSLNIYREDGVYVASCPPLMLSSYGDSPRQAEKKFKEALGLWFESVLRRNTLELALRELGWKAEPDTGCLLPKRATFTDSPVPLISQKYFPLHVPCAV